MPVMNAMESARGMRAFERERGQQPTVIIALTGLASATAQQEAFSSVRLNKLLNILNDWTPNDGYIELQGIISI
ncbi:histidine kinase protein [Rutstroemia sp. NJR-2017a WRK4]|nr:histidine kinase protein [Rutstroemia sp. NJR-2017a WRK4]